MAKEKKKKADNEIQNNHQELNAIQSDISVSVNSEDGKQKEYTYPQALTSDLIAHQAAVSTTADMGIQVRQAWIEKIKERVDDIKDDYYLDEIELNFGIAKFRIKRIPPTKK